MEPQPSEVSVVSPVSLAIEHVKRMLFRPFNLGKWFTIGFCAWLANLLQGGSGGSYNGNSGVKTSGSSAPTPFPDFSQVRIYLHDNLHWILPLSIGLVVIVLVVVVVLLWLSSRGQFMLLHCVVLDRAEVAVPWSKYKREARSLWLFRLALGAVCLLFMLPLLAWALWTVYNLLHVSKPLTVDAILPFFEMGITWILIIIPFTIAGCFTRHFVVPIMYQRGTTCTEGWRILLPLLKANVGRFILYLLFQIVIAIALSLITLGFIICTCCIGALLLMIPVVSAVVVLPLTVFQRSYPLYYLSQYGAEFDFFGPPPIPPQTVV